MNKHRVNNELVDINIDNTPKSILYGVPLTMGWQLTKQYWHKYTQGDTANKGKKHKERIQESRECEICDFLEQENINKTCNARQAIMQIKK